MSDTNQDNNPFRRLNRHDFPDKPKTGKQTSPGKKKPLEKKQPEPTPIKTDDALFLQAMESFRPMGNARPEPTESLAFRTGVLPQTERQPARRMRQTAPPHPAAAPAEPDPQRTIPQQESAPQQETALPEFTAAMRDVRPLTGKGRKFPPEPQCTSVPQAESDTLRDFLEGKFAFALHHTHEYVEGHVIGLDPITLHKLQAGQFSPEGSLDLHGLNAPQAYQRLIGFMRNAYLRSWRTVLIVSGRGLNSPNGLPVLREKVQIWLTQEPLRRVVLAFCSAQQAAGGAGALYVLLRKKRKDQGKVQWDRIPMDPDLIV